MKSTIVKLAAGVVLVASFVFSVQSMRLHAQKEAEWDAKLGSVLNELQIALDKQGLQAISATGARGPVADEALTKQVSDNKKDVGLILDELRSLRGLIEHHGSHPAQAAGTAVGYVDDEVSREEQAIQRELARDARKQDAIAEFQSQPVDPDWSGRMGSAISNIVTGDAASGVSIPEFACRSSSCEIYWAIDSELTPLEKFERENYVLEQMGGLGLGSVVYLDSASSGEYRAIFSRPPDRKQAADR